MDGQSCLSSCIAGRAVRSLYLVARFSLLSLSQIKMTNEVKPLVAKRLLHGVSVFEKGDFGTKKEKRSLQPRKKNLLREKEGLERFLSNLTQVLQRVLYID